MAKVMSRYSLNFEEVFQLRIRVFWGLFRQISVLNAEEGLRTLRLLQLSQTGDKNALKEFIRDQEALIETAVIPNREVEAREGLAKLKKLASAG